MTREELITIGEHKVRNNENLMLSYLNEFESIFGRKPKCAGCTFKSDWKKFVKGKQTQTQKIIPMKTDKTFELNRGAKSKIHTYKIAKKAYRSYGNTMSEDFAIAFLTNGNEEELAERKKLFAKLPKIAKVKVEKNATFELNGETIDLEVATHKQMDAYEEANDIDLGDAKKVVDKRLVIAKTL